MNKLNFINIYFFVFVLIYLTVSCKSTSKKIVNTNKVHYQQLDNKEFINVSSLFSGSNLKKKDISLIEDTSSLQEAVSLRITSYSEQKKSSINTSFVMISQIKRFRAELYGKNVNLCLFQSYLSHEPQFANKLHLFGNFLNGDFELKSNTISQLHHIFDNPLEQKGCNAIWNEKYHSKMIEQLTFIGTQLKHNIPKVPCSTNFKTEDISQCQNWKRLYFPENSQNTKAVCVNQIDPTEDNGFCSIRNKNGQECPLFQNLLEMPQDFSDDSTQNTTVNSASTFLCHKETNSACVAHKKTNTEKRIGVCLQR